MASDTRASRVVRSLRNGQITIPAEFRRRLGIREDSLVQVTLADGELRLKPVHVADRAAGSPWLKELYELYAPVRDEASSFSEDEINAAIDAAVKAVRQQDD